VLTSLLSTRPTEGVFRVRQLPLAEQSESHSRPQASARPQALVIGDRRRGVMRGVIRAVILSFVVWLTAGYLTFVLL
jgi:hypothetical protein